MRLRRTPRVVLRLGLSLALIAGIVTVGATVAHSQPPLVNVQITANSGVTPVLTVTAGPNRAPQINLKAAQGQQLGFSADRWIAYDGRACYVFQGWDVALNIDGSYTHLASSMGASYTVPATTPSGAAVDFVSLDASYLWYS